MATNKNQHFVPRCYLRQFASDSNAKVINLYNIDRQKFITGAPVKSQCSGDYFYGTDAYLENIFQFIESSYATTVREMMSSGYRLSEDHKSQLITFWLLQHLRTEAASRRVIDMFDATQTVIDSTGSQLRIKAREAIDIAMKTFATETLAVSDLKACLVRNHSDIPFVTSDDPAILTNRWGLANPAKTLRSFGLNTAGALILLPRSPKLFFLAYDGDIYSIPHVNGWISINDAPDVAALNEHQYLNCRANLFVQSSSHFATVEESFNAARARRPLSKHRIYYAIEDGKEGNSTRFKVVDPETIGDHRRAIISSQTIHAEPSDWPKFLHWRSDAFAYYNGTGQGYVRKDFSRSKVWRPPFKRIRLFRA